MFPGLDPIYETVDEENKLERSLIVDSSENFSFPIPQRPSSSCSARVCKVEVKVIANSSSSESHLTRLREDQGYLPFL